MNLALELKKLEKMKNGYIKARKDFNKRWAEYVKNSPVKEWSKQHTKFINADLKRRQEKYKSMTREQYLKWKSNEEAFNF